MVRNQGTLGGSLAYSDPAACYPSAVLALKATIHTQARDIAADDFFLGLYQTALEPGEMIQAVTFPKPLGAAYIKFKHPASKLALVGVFVARFGPRPSNKPCKRNSRRRWHKRSRCPRMRCCPTCTPRPPIGPPWSVRWLREPWHKSTPAERQPWMRRWLKAQPL